MHISFLAPRGALGLIGFETPNFRGIGRFVIRELTFETSTLESAYQSPCLSFIVQDDAAKTEAIGACFDRNAKGLAIFVNYFRKDFISTIVCQGQGLCLLSDFTRGGFTVEVDS